MGNDPTSRRSAVPTQPKPGQPNPVSRSLTTRGGTTTARYVPQICRLTDRRGRQKIYSSSVPVAARRQLQSPVFPAVLGPDREWQHIPTEYLVPTPTCTRSSP
jgi:hypothetical protein